MLRTGRTTLALLLPFLAGCAAEPPAAPPVVEEPRFGNGGPGGKNGKGAEPTLKEYWVAAAAEECGGANLIHVLAGGDLDGVNPSVVYDYFSNGLVDDDYSAHYEFFHGAPAAATGLEPLSNGDVHADFCWSGERRLNPDGTVVDHFADLVTTDLDGAGGDPFAFQLRFTQDGSAVGQAQPQGIVDDGRVLGASASVTDSFHGRTGVTSYAVFRGAPATGAVFLTDLRLTDASCKVTTRRIGRGKNATTETVTEVAATVHSATSDGSTAPPEAWLEYHLADATDGAATAGTTRHDADPEAGLETFAFSGSLPGERRSLQLQLWVDYVYPVGRSTDLVYDPRRNSDSGFTTTWGGPDSDIGGQDWAVAKTPAISLSCG